MLRNLLFLAVTVTGIGIASACTPAPIDAPLHKSPTAKGSGTGTTTPPKKDESVPTEPAPGGGEQPPPAPAGDVPPTLTQVTPAAVTIGTAGDVSITLTGTHFAEGVKVSVGGVELPATATSATQLTATVPHAQIAATGTFRVTVLAKPGVESNALTFTVANPTSTTITTVVPGSVTAGATSALSINITGSGFAPSSVVKFNGTNLTTTFTSATALSASVPASALATAGHMSVTVTTGATVVSLPFSFEVKAGATTTTTTAACTYTCADYGYSAGQCYQNWYCIPSGQYAGCLGQGTCTDTPTASDPAPDTSACDYTCADYDYLPGECYDDWTCNGATGCLEPLACGI